MWLAERILYCYQLNSGVITPATCTEADAEIIELMTPLLKSGTHRMLSPMDKYECRITVTGTTLLATICCDDRACIASGVAVDQEGAELLWPEIEHLCESLSHLPALHIGNSAKRRMPEATPWCTVLTVNATAEETSWMEDFVRCLSWAWVSNVKEAGRI